MKDSEDLKSLTLLLNKIQIWCIKCTKIYYLLTFSYRIWQFSGYIEFLVGLQFAVGRIETQAIDGIQREGGQYPGGHITRYTSMYRIATIAAGRDVEEEPSVDRITHDMHSRVVPIGFRGVGESIATFAGR